MKKFTLLFLLLSCLSLSNCPDDDQPNPIIQNFITINIEDTEVIESLNKVKVRFKLTDINNIGVSGMTDSDFDLYESVMGESEQLIDPLEAPRLIVPSPESYGYGTMIIMDLSGSVINEIENIKNASINYVDNLFSSINSGSMAVSVQFFDGRSELQEVISFSENRNEIINAISDMDTSLQENDNTALYHGIIQGCDLINTKRMEFLEDPEIKIFSTSVVVFSDGVNSNFTDGVNRGLMNASINQSFLNGTQFYCVAAGSNTISDVVNEIGKNGVFFISDYSQLNFALNNVLELITREANSIYELEICSAKSGILVNYKLQAKNFITFGGLGTYNSENFSEMDICEIN